MKKFKSDVTTSGFFGAAHQKLILRKLTAVFSKKNNNGTRA